VAGFKAPHEQIRVLDFGSGSGRIAKEMAKIGYDVYGCESYRRPPTSIRNGRVKSNKALTDCRMKTKCSISL
jgi:2-polyprenyl-3-methyl-5-hydroxy-6-metoxy-1,4-benzoquinol methylase